MALRWLPVRDARGVPPAGHGLRRISARGRRGLAGSFVLLTGLTAFPGVAEAELRISRHAFARTVEQREPVATAEVFPRDVGRIFFFTEVEGVASPGQITHVWFHGAEEMASVSLEVAPPSWRTWSSKRLLPIWTGDWTVEVRDGEGRLLLSASCRVE